MFARMPSGRDSPKTPALAISPLQPKRAACGVSHTQTANLPSGCFLCEFEINRPIRGDLRLYQEDLIAIWILKIKPL